MDAQNVVESTAKQDASPPKRPTTTDHDRQKKSVSKSPVAARPAPSAKTSAQTDPSSAPARNDSDDGGADGNSDAETIVLPGKDGHSPSKTRKMIKHEEKSDGEDNIRSAPGFARKPAAPAREGKEKDTQEPGAGDRNDGHPDKRASTITTAARDGTGSALLKKQRPHAYDQQRRQDGGSSGLSSAPASPPRHRRRSAELHRHPDSDSEGARSPKAAAPKEKSKPLEKLISHKRKAPKAESDDEAEIRKARRQRISGPGFDANSHSARPQKEGRPSKSSHDMHSSARNRSISPNARLHRRSISTQLPSQSSNGLGHKKKRIPAPLSTDYHSDESSASGSPHPRSSKLRSLATPATADSTISPAKMAPHKKHLDAHGQTFLARACAKGDYDTAKLRLADRPEDLNVADYAGNTPLQIASLNGHEEIVKLLIDAGCNVDCLNNVKDTPLLDAVDNGHLGVVKLLLDAGVNPRKANVNGEEPIDRVTDETDNAEEIRTALSDAKLKMGERRRTSEEHHQNDNEGRSSYGPDSPRHSPATTSSHMMLGSRRSGTVRSTKTSNHLLYMPMDDKTLRQAAGRGDEETVTRILQVRDTFDDPESMVAAARGGHDIVMQLLLALGNANPDPPPVPSMPQDLGTPMLAAIGQENLKVIRLLLDQTNFDPTRRFKGETYHEIARRRQGTNWKEEEHMLKSAYDEHRRSHKEHKETKGKSPARREREQDKEGKRANRTDSTDGPSSRLHKRKLSSPLRDPKKVSLNKVPTSPREKKRSGSSTGHDDQSSQKRGPGRPRKDDRIPTIAIPDREASPPAVKHINKPKRAESDLTGLSSEGEAVKPRRKLVSGKELKGEREKQRRASMASTASSLKEPSSPHESRHEEGSERPKTEKYHDRTKALKRDESKDRPSMAGETAGKRHRSSATPPHPGAGEHGGEVPVKRRRLDVEGKERRHRLTTSPDGRPRKAGPSLQRDQDDEERREAIKARKAERAADRDHRESGKLNSSEKSIHVKSEDPDVEMRDASHEAEAVARSEHEKEERRQKARLEAEAVAREARRREDETKRREEEERRKREEEGEAQRREEVEKKRKELKEQEELKRREEERKRREEEERKQKEAERKQREETERKLREEVERKQREAEERKRREEEERKLREEERRLREAEERKRREAEEHKRREEERKRREEEERKKREEEEARRREEEERKKREEEERLRKEQLEREAAEEARRKKEEEERKEEERRQRLQREEMERRRAAAEAERRRIREEQERLRLFKLPPLLRWLDRCENPKTSKIAEKFVEMQGVRYDCIRPEATGTPEGRGQWLLNTQLALLLGEKDLSLSRYTAWERLPVSLIAKRVIWRLESDRYALTSRNLYELGKELPDGYYHGVEPEKMGYRTIEKLRSEAWEKFSAMDMFFVKVSDLMYIIPTIPHLRQLRLAVVYRELPEQESDLARWSSPQKWRNDPGADQLYPFAPSSKYYINGALVGERKPGSSAVSKTPFPEKRMPRRGLVTVSPDDPDYARLCNEQGLEHLLNGNHTTASPTGFRASTNSMPPQVQQGILSMTEAPPLVNGVGQHHQQLQHAHVEPPPALTNGINGGMNE